jgi:hypothetical protein
MLHSVIEIKNMTILKKAIESFVQYFSIDFRSVHFDSIEKTAFEKGSLYAFEKQEKDEFADIHGLQKSFIEQDFNNFLSRLPNDVKIKISKEKLKESFTSGYSISWNCPIIVNRVRGFNKFEYMNYCGKKAFLNLLWSNSKMIENKGFPPVLESVI